MLHYPTRIAYCKKGAYGPALLSGHGFTIASAPLLLDFGTDVLYVVIMSDISPRTIRQPTLELPDPETVPPRQPELGECCASGCVPCVFDLYEDAMERYRAQHHAWKTRQARREK